MIDYGKIIPEKIVNIPKSGIRKYFDMITPDMKDVISLTVGQPDFVTPWHIREAGIQSLETGKTFYTANAGLEELRIELENLEKSGYFAIFFLCTLDKNRLYRV